MPSKTLKCVKLLENGRLRPMPLFTGGVCNMRPDRAGWAYDNDEAPAKVVPVYEIVQKTRRAGGSA